MSDHVALIILSLLVAGISFTMCAHIYFSHIRGRR